MNEYLLKHASREQLSLWGRRSQEVQMINRMMADPPLYRPVRDFCGFIVACSFQCDMPIEQQILLFNGGRYDSFKAIINNEKQYGIRGGWHHWLSETAKRMPGQIITE